METTASWTDNMAGGTAFHHFIDELKRRRVFRVATLYIVSFWPVIQIADILSPALELPDSIMRYLVIAFAACFPVALVLAWVFDINKNGVSITADTTTSEEAAAPLIGSRSELTVVAALLAVVAVLFMIQFITGPETEQQIVTSSPVTSLPQAAPTSKSVAVLPFVTFSGSAEDQQFADGLTEELLNVLARIKTLRVAARTSTFAYRGVNKDVTVIGRELRVGTILEGSIRRNDVNDTVRITAQLIDATTGSHLWSKTYDREFSDVFAIQDDIASAVVEELQLTLLGEEKTRLASNRKSNPEALAAYGVAQAELARRADQSLNDAIRFFERAASLEPGRADYYTGIATAHALRVSYGYTGDREAEIQEAQTAVDKAFAIEPESGSAWATQGLIYMQQENRDAALAALEKAMAYNPSHAPAFMWYASLQKTTNEKLTWYQRAYELDPRSPVIGYNIANIHFLRGHIGEAMKVYGQILEADPNYHSAYSLAGRIAESRGRLDEAINQYTHAYELSGSDQYAMSLAQLYTDLGEFDKSHAWIAKLDDHGIPQYGVFFDWLRIAAYAADDRMDDARPLLRQKVAAANTKNENFYHEDATMAAYFLNDPQAVIRNFEKITGKATVEQFDNSNRIDAMFAAAHTYQQLGQVQKAQPIVIELDTLLAELAETGINLHYSYWSNLSKLDLLKGEPRMALVHLQRAIDEGLRSSWALRLDPAFADLKDTPAFDGMIAGLQSRMSIMREQLAIANTFDSDWSG